MWSAAYVHVEHGVCTPKFLSHQHPRWLEQWGGWVKTPGRGRSSQEQLVLGEWRPRERVELPVGETVRGQWSRHAAPPKRRQKRPGAREEQKLLRSRCHRNDMGCWCSNRESLISSIRACTAGAETEEVQITQQTLLSFVCEGQEEQGDAGGVSKVEETCY